MTDKKTGSFLGGVAIGAAIGVVSGVMLNPRTTRRVRRALLDTREALQGSLQQLPQQLPTYTQRLRDTTQTWSSVVLDHVSDFAEDLQDDWRGTAQRLKEAAIAGWEASRQEYLAAIDASETHPSEMATPDALVSVAQSETQANQADRVMKTARALLSPSGQPQPTQGLSSPDE